MIMIVQVEFHLQNRCDKGDLVLLCLDERHDQYVVFTVGTNLHFLHSESLEGLGLKTGEWVVFLNVVVSWK